MPSEHHHVQAFEKTLVGRAPKTIQTYTLAVEHFIDWLATKPGGTPFRMQLMTETAIQDYLDTLAHSGYAPRTRSKKLSALRRFCRWAMDEGWLKRDPTRQIEAPTVVMLAPRELSPDQRYVLKTLVEENESLRTAAIFALGYWAGLRVSDVAHLKLEHCHVTQRTGTITLIDAKGGKTRTLDLHTRARRALHNYLEEAESPERDQASAYVFTSQRAAWLRSQQRPDHLSTRGIEYLWQALKKQAAHDAYELIHDIRFHDLRHDWAHRARASGWSLEEIAVYAGHQTRDGTPAIATTARYTLPTRQQIKARLDTLLG